MRIQHLFEIIGTHLLEQGEQAQIDSETCCYVACNNGKLLQCAAAVLVDIDKLKAHPQFAFLNTHMFPRLHNIYNELIKDEYKDLGTDEIKFVRVMQLIHDTNEDECTNFRQLWYTRLKELATNQELDTSWMNKLVEGHPEWKINP